MALNTTPVFPYTPVLNHVQATAANTNRDGTGTIYDGPTGAADGTLIECVKMQAQVTTTAGMARVYVKKSGGSYRLYDEVPMTAVSAGSAVPCWNYTWTPPFPLVLKSGDIIAFSINNAEATNFWTQGEDMS